jgi:hypothetical protein
MARNRNDSGQATGREEKADWPPEAKQRITFSARLHNLNVGSEDMGSGPKPHHAAAIQVNPQNLLTECCKVTMMSLLYGMMNYHALFGRRASLWR